MSLDPNLSRVMELAERLGYLGQVVGLAPEGQNETPWIEHAEEVTFIQPGDGSLRNDAGVGQVVMLGLVGPSLDAFVEMLVVIAERAQAVGRVVVYSEGFTQLLTAFREVAPVPPVLDRPQQLRNVG